ncbi:MAG: elongation factor P [Thermodesulfovibrionales bacterium]|nr:elongation factor P [Thermodesulfovibrionales bacterium]
MIAASELRRGMKIEFKGEPYEVIESQHVKMQQRAPIMRVKIKSLKTGRVIDETFNAGDKIPLPKLEEKEMQYLYSQGNEYVFMDTETYEQVTISEEALGEARKFIKENMNVRVLYYREQPLTVEPPMFVELKVIETEPPFKGDTASAGSKPARLETGAIIKVPFHIVEGDIIKVDTRTGEYVERVK